MERVGDGLQGCICCVCVLCQSCCVGVFQRFFLMGFFIDRYRSVGYILSMVFSSGFSLGDVGLILLNLVRWLAPALCVFTCVW